jgi:hypothetical protein
MQATLGEESLLNFLKPARVRHIARLVGLMHG